MDKDQPAGLVRVAAAFLAAALFALPLVWALATSLKPPGEYVSSSAALLPREFTLMHYEALANARVWRLALNSLVVTLGTTALALAAALPAAYALARLAVRGDGGACTIEPGAQQIDDHTDGTANQHDASEIDDETGGGKHSATVQATLDTLCTDLAADEVTLTGRGSAA